MAVADVTVINCDSIDGGESIILLLSSLLSMPQECFPNNASSFMNECVSTDFDSL